MRGATWTGRIAPPQQLVRNRRGAAPGIMSCAQLKLENHLDESVARYVQRTGERGHEIPRNTTSELDALGGLPRLESTLDQRLDVLARQRQALPSNHDVAGSQLTGCCQPLQLTGVLLEWNKHRPHL